MTVHRLSLYDLTGIQTYIFGSNRLKENLGASYLASQALEDQLKLICQAVSASGSHAELHWSGGGNAVVATSRDVTLEVARRLSQWVLVHAPGLRFLCAHTEWTGDAAAWRAAYQALTQDLARQKSSTLLEPVFDGAGVTASCQSTGEPACVIEMSADQKRVLGPSALARLNAADDATKRLKKEFPRSAGWTYSDEVETLGGSRGDQSMLGILHFDGNSMGELFKKTLLEGPAAGARERVRALSDTIRSAGSETLRLSLSWLEERLTAGCKPSPDEAKGQASLAPGKTLGLSLVRDLSGNWIFPVRPLVYGGDDITLICDARVAVDLAACMLQTWHEQTQRLLGKTMTACVGVALVKMRYPFFRAYQLAEDLCQNAKRAVREKAAHGGTQCSALDWEIHAGGPMLKLKQRRARFSQLQADAVGEAKRLTYTLHTRPYFIPGSDRPDTGMQSWTWFRDVLLRQLQDPSGPYAQRSVQLHRLAEALQQGPHAAEAVLTAWRQAGLALLPTPPDMIPTKTGFFGRETPYLDALELLDVAVPWHLLDATATPNRSHAQDLTPESAGSIPAAPHGGRP